MEGKKFCSGCGYELNDEVKFCPSCGAQIENKKQEQTSSTNETKDSILETAIYRVSWWLKALSGLGQFVMGLGIIVSVAILVFVSLNTEGKGYFWTLGVSCVIWFWAYKYMGQSAHKFEEAIEEDEKKLNQRLLAHGFRKLTIFVVISFVFLILQVIVSGYFTYENASGTDYSYPQQEKRYQRGFD